MKPNVNSRNKIYDIGDKEFNLTTCCVYSMGKFITLKPDQKKTYKNRNQKGSCEEENGIHHSEIGGIITNDVTYVRWEFKKKKK